jgi:hypothetical protein
MTDQMIRSEQQRKEEAGLVAAKALIKGGKAKMKLVTMHTDVKARYTRGSGRAVLLCDVSYSMVDQVQGKRKIDHLRETLEHFGGVRRVSFSTEVYPNDVPEPKSSTRLANALRFVRDEEEFSCDSVILISDGLPDSETDALDAAISLNRPVHVVFIGDMTTQQGRDGEAFMRRLAEATGGKQFTADSSDSMKLLSTTLTGAIRGLLGPAPEDARGPIIL